MAGDLLNMQQVQVLSVTVGEPQPASEFQIRFPPDTILYDARINKYYRIQPNESMIETSANGEPLGSGATIPQPVGSEIPQPGESFFSRHKWLLIGAALGVIATAFFYFLRTRSGGGKPA